MHAEIHTHGYVSGFMFPNRPRAHFGFAPSVFGLVHLAVITSIVTKHSRLLHAHQNRWCWYVDLMTIITPPPFHCHCTGKQSNPKSHTCLPSIDYGWIVAARYFEGLPFQFGFSLLFSRRLLFCSGEGFLFQFYFRSGCAAQFVNKGMSLWSRISQQTYIFSCISNFG